MTDYKDVVIDNDAIVNTDPKELPEEPYNIPQGKRPELNPNPGYGEDEKTKPAIKTDLKDGGRGTPVQTVVAPKFGDKVEQAVVNFLNGIKIKGKNLEDYIDSEGGVTEAELQAALAPILTELESTLGVIEIDAEDATTTFEELGIGEKVMSGNYILRGNYDSSYLNYIPVIVTDNYIYFIRIDTIGSKVIEMWFINIEGSDVTLVNMYDSEINLTINHTEGNPTLAGTESNLTALQIGSTKYKVPGGTKLYKHQVQCDITTNGTTGVGGFSFISTSNKSLATAQFTDIDALGSIEVSKYYQGSTTHYIKLTGHFSIGAGLSTLTYLVLASDLTLVENTISNITDTVTEL